MSLSSSSKMLRFSARSSSTVAFARTHTTNPCSQFRTITSSPVSRGINLESLKLLDEWIARDKKLVTTATLHTEHLSDLYVTLPTRDGSRKPYRAPHEGNPLPYGHHLAFFHPRNPESSLRTDGTDADFCPPEPFTRRMWAGGSIEWKKPLIIGHKAIASSSIGSVKKKGFEMEKEGTTPNPMVFVNQKIEYSHVGSEEVAIEEERSHVYLSAPANSRGVRAVTGLPSPDFSFTYLPTPTTLFRFSALTFNGHYIHLDKDYAHQEGYSERLVHGPLTALMLLEALSFHAPETKLKSFEYRARNPLVVSEPVTIYGAWLSNRSVQLWAVSGDKEVVGMTGKATLFDSL
ncbi:hypothetical protein C8Q75DRAFT_740221 [Abortiporus biennis]|nr:hypothetical protein C8Q75DRAFT_740221 [Abortiporus biennis]